MRGWKGRTLLPHWRPPKSDTDVVSLAAVHAGFAWAGGTCSGRHGAPRRTGPVHRPGLAPSDAPEAVDAVLEAAMDSSPVERSAAPDSVATRSRGGVRRHRRCRPPAQPRAVHAGHARGGREATHAVHLAGRPAGLQPVRHRGGHLRAVPAGGRALADALALRYSGIIIGALRPDVQARARAARAQRKRARGREAGAGKREGPRERMGRRRRRQEEGILRPRGPAT